MTAKLTFGLENRLGTVNCRIPWFTLPLRRAMLGRCAAFARAAHAPLAGRDCAPAGAAGARSRDIGGAPKIFARALGVL